MEEAGGRDLGANEVRGEVVALLAGTERRLCLTLGALAEIETVLGVGGEELAARLRAMTAADLMRVLSALLRGGGEMEAAAMLRQAPVDLETAADAVARAFEAGCAG